MLRAVMENDDLECGFSAAAANAGGTKLGSCENFRRVGVVAEQQAQEKRFVRFGSVDGCAPAAPCSGAFL
jgi:hypothetical protein